MRIVLILLAGYIGYKFGYDRSKKVQSKYRIQIKDSTGTYYLVVEEGSFQKTADISDSTLFTYFESKQIVDVLKIYSPNMTYNIEEEKLYINA